jgi:hypothetical protein
MEREKIRLLLLLLNLSPRALGGTSHHTSHSTLAAGSSHHTSHSTLAATTLAFAATTLALAVIAVVIVVAALALAATALALAATALALAAIGVVVTVVVVVVIVVAATVRNLDPNVFIVHLHHAGMHHATATAAAMHTGAQLAFILFRNRNASSILLLLLLCGRHNDCQHDEKDGENDIGILDHGCFFCFCFWLLVWMR